MLLLGLLLMAASGAFIGLLIADNLSGGPEYQVTILGNDLVKLDSLGIFLSGVALALLFCLGLALMWPRRRRARAAGRHTYRGVRPAEPAERPEFGDTGARTAPVMPEERAAEQGGRAGDVPGEAGRRHGRHLFGH
ncbi:hypothetical protein ACGF07_20760 [Kitasatospora sp. NPDC048194]|uniref:hypothetical protein n=1 Tax=Kitasatospora sp. NPDC048194 TaxID=3364045 RepID=UPI00371561DA